VILESVIQSRPRQVLPLRERVPAIPCQTAIPQQLAECLESLAWPQMAQLRRHWAKRNLAQALVANWNLAAPRQEPGAESPRLGRLEPELRKWDRQAHWDWLAESILDWPTNSAVVRERRGR
jgi:hypothetical protein